MTYKGLVDRIKDTVNRHKMLVDFGYGQLSDIKVLDEGGDGADYPYAFLLPTGIARTNQSVTYSFSLIVMEMALNPREVLEVQSNCIQYINDIIADLRFDTTFDGDVNLQQGIQVFRERFQDEVAGATLNLQITVADQINDCISPIQRLIELDTRDAVIGLRYYNSNSVGSRRIFDSWPVPEAPAEYQFTGYVDIVLQTALTDDAAPYDVPYMSWLQDADNPRFIVDQEFDGTLVGETQRISFNYTFTLEDVPPDNNDVAFCFGYSTGSGFYPDQATTITTYANAIETVGGELTIYRIEK